MVWTIVITAVITLSLIIAFWEHGVRGKKLARLFRRYVYAHNGKVRPGNPLAFPQMTFRRGGLTYRVTAMANAGATAIDRGPFSTVAVDLHGDTGRRIRLTRRSGVISAVVDRLAEAAALGGAAATNNDAFDQAFRTHGQNDDFLQNLLSQEVKSTLVNAPLDNLEIDVDRTQIRVHCSGILATPAELQALISCAAALADRFLPE